MVKTQASDRASRSETAHKALIRAMGLHRSIMEAHFASRGLSGSQWGVLRALQRAEGAGLEGLRLTDLGERLLVRAPSVTGIVDRLERLGMLVRTAAADDQRAKIVKLTPAARGLLAEFQEPHAQQIHRMMKVLTPGEQKDLKGIMEKLADHWESLADNRFEKAQ